MSDWLSVTHWCGCMTTAWQPSAWATAALRSIASHIDRACASPGWAGRAGVFSLYHAESTAIYCWTSRAITGLTDDCSAFAPPPYLTPRACSQRKSTQLHDAFIGHARQRRDLIGCSETGTVGACALETPPLAELEFSSVHVL